MSRAPQASVLVVDRESDEARALVAALRERHMEVLTAHDDEGAFHALDEEPIDCLVAELSAPRIDGMALLRHARARDPEVCAVMITDSAPIDLAVEAMRLGAYDVQARPIHLERLLAVLERGLSHRRLAARVADMEEGLERRLAVGGLDGRSRAVSRVLERIRHLASSRAPVLIEGEPGTGKGLVAQALHRHSARRHERFVAAQCSALPSDQLERELFGEESGAEVHRARPGRIELADQGTLFLDDIEAASPIVQLRLLRLLQERRVERVGARASRQADVRLLAATSADLDALAADGRFRADLLQRIGVVRIGLPPLRERREDIPLLARAALEEADREHGRRVTGFTAAAMERLARHAWPGNIRELRAVVEGMVVAAKGRRALDVADLPPTLRDAAAASERVDVSVGMSAEETERRLIEATLQATGFDKPRAAAMLGIGLRTLYRKIERFRLG